MTSLMPIKAWRSRSPTSQLPYTSQLLDSLIQSINPSDYTLYSTTHGPYSYLLFCLCQLFRRHSPDEGFP